MLEAIIMERIQADPDYCDLADDEIRKIREAISTKVDTMMKTYRPVEFNITDVFAVDKMVLDILDLLRDGVVSREIFSDKHILSEIRERREAEVKIYDRGEEIAPEPNSTLRCKACGAQRIYVVLVQTRSSDEPATQFTRCLDCGRLGRS